MCGCDFHQLLRDLVFIILTYGRREVSWSVLMRKKREVAIVRRFLKNYFVGITSVSHSNTYSKNYKEELNKSNLMKGIDFRYINVSDHFNPFKPYLGLELIQTKPRRHSEWIRILSQTEF